MKIQFFGDLSGTGFGTVTMDLGRELLALGHDVRFVSQNEMGEALPEPFNTRTFQVNDPSGWLALSEHGGPIGLLDGRLWQDNWQPDAAIILGDYYAVEVVMERYPDLASVVPMYHYVPIEGVGLPPAVAPLWNELHPVAMTNAGADELERLLGTRPPVVYHGVDTKDFWPVSAERPIYLMNGVKLRSKAACRDFFFEDVWPDMTPKLLRELKMILRTDRNMVRKRYASWIRAMAPVLGSRPDTFAAIHCGTKDLGGNLYHERSKYRKLIQNRIWLSPYHDQPYNGLERNLLNVLYNAADLYVSVSAEGFGLTIAEAMACGVPAIAIDFAAGPEVIGPGGKLAPISGLIDNEYNYFWAAVDEKKLSEITLDLLSKPDEMRELGRKAAAHIRSQFTWSNAARQFTEIMQPAAVSELVVA